MKMSYRWAVVLAAAISIAVELGFTAQLSAERGRNKAENPRLRSGVGGRRRPGPRTGQRGRQGQSSDRGGPPPGFYTDVPEHLFNIILGRPTRYSVMVSVLAYEQM